jgi:hypothetical protein
MSGTSTTWYDGIKSLGKFDGTATGLVSEHLVHVTVTNATAIVGIGVHISYYLVQGSLLDERDPSKAAARIYFASQGVGKGLVFDKVWTKTGPGPKVNVTFKDEAQTYFYSFYPTHKKPAVITVDTSDTTQWPSLSATMKKG